MRMAAVRCPDPVDPGDWGPAEGPAVDSVEAVARIARDGSEAREAAAERGALQVVIRTSDPTIPSCASGGSGGGSRHRPCRSGRPATARPRRRGTLGSDGKADRLHIAAGRRCDGTPRGADADRVGPWTAAEAMTARHRPDPRDGWGGGWPQARGQGSGRIIRRTAAGEGARLARSAWGLCNRLGAVAGPPPRSGMAVGNARSPSAVATPRPLAPALRAMVVPLAAGVVRRADPWIRQPAHGGPGPPHGMAAPEARNGSGDDRPRSGTRQLRHAGTSGGPGAAACRAALMPVRAPGLRGCRCRATSAAPVSGRAGPRRGRRGRAGQGSGRGGGGWA